ncbi:MAG: histidinol dehydrogenase [Alphaproteobacteria bacterium CG_4_10_14_0_2_um_filter_63_37]|nr:MAG: histidinol dehydrogenase [Proteobacteria bacterium CG1_02_64_396]PJA24311.1 MAG: histidinol dehydrogenase [Alphaproteobacteria bacterium CG_4_10_14_0_2_um_filter_63_37]
MAHLLDQNSPDFAERFAQYTAHFEGRQSDVDATVRQVIDAVASAGDEALLHFTAQWDRMTLASPAELEIPTEEIMAALFRLDPQLRADLELAAQRIRRYHEHGLPKSWEYEEADGSKLGQRIAPVDRAGVYVPGGKAAYPSSVLMNVIPAQVAGVREIIMVVPTPGGEVLDVVLAAAAIAGVDRVFRIGGAQAIAALALGTATVPQVDVIVGPGNAYVASAKRQMFGRVGIDMVAGPSEILIIADESANPEWLAVDLLSQAEHDEDAQSVLITPSRALAEATIKAVEAALPTLSRSAIAAQSWNTRGLVVIARDLEGAAEIAHSIAPEHLELAVADPRALLPKIGAAGAIFMGHHTPEALGDYVAGPNHVLPTSGTARFSSPLGCEVFLRRTSLIEMSAAGCRTLAPVAERLAKSEGLTAHGASAALRI